MASSKVGGTEYIHDPFHIVGQHMQAHFRTDVFFKVRVRKCVAPVQALIAPKECSTV
jgi:hypothetical protein